MAVTRILVEATLWETRAAAFSAGAPVALFHESPLCPRGPRLGAVHTVTLREAPRGLDGGFCETAGGEPVYVRFGKAPRPALGSKLDVVIVAEARPGKSARARALNTEGDTPAGANALEAWATHLRFAGDLEDAATPGEREEIDAAFAAALAPKVTLEGGGRLIFARTEAVFTIDVDSGGRDTRADRKRGAQSLNQTALSAAGAQLALRGIGGLGVIDCVAPISKRGGSALKAAFLEAFRSVSPRKAAALAPSPFGLLEVSLAWAECPIGDVLGHETGLRPGAAEPAPIATLLDGLRGVERELRRAPAAEVVLRLPEGAFAEADARPGGLAALASAIRGHYGASIKVEPSPTGRLDVVRR
ncbi:MAG: ribonuclease E/G [Pseudomonadota bacterium]